MNKRTKLSLAQQDVYYEQLLNPKSARYNIGGYATFKGQIDIDQFKRIVEGASEWFDIFSVKFDFTGDEPFQFFSDSRESVLVEKLDLSSAPDPEKEAFNWMQDRFNTAFDLRQDRLYLHSIIKLADDEYLFFGCFHHLIVDGYGFAIYFNYLVEEYKKFLQGSNDSIAIYPSYKDTINKGLNYHQSKHYHQDSLYWKERYDVIPELIFGPKKHKEDKCALLSLSLSKTDNALLDRLAEQTKLNIAQLTIAALLLYFGKTREQQVFGFGTSIHNRRNREDRKTVGMFSGILPFKGEFAPDQLLSDLISDIGRTQRYDYKHGLYPVSHLNRSLNLLSEGRMQLFDLIVNYEKLPFIDSISPNLSVQIKELRSTEDLGFPLTICWFDYGLDLPLELHAYYQGEYFSEVEIELLFQRLLFILRQFEMGLDQPVQNISILPEEEKHQLLTVFNDSAVSYPTDQTVVDLFEAQAAKTPEARAVVYEGNTLTYQELDERSNQLALHLINKGIKPDTLVGICIDRSLEMLVGIWGILKSGGAYVPIDPEYPQDRKAYMLEDSGVSILLSDHNNGAGFSDKENVEVIELDGHWGAISGESSESFQSVSSPSNLAYVIYTSGSTGRPKGVQVSHYNLVDYFHGLVDKTNIQSCKTFGLSSSIATDLGNTVLYPSLLTGAALYVLSEDELISADKMSAMDIDCLKMVPSHWKTLQTKDAVFVPNKCLILGGEAFTDDVLDLLSTHAVSCEVYNHYGPTETTIGKLIHKVSLREKPDHSVPLGTPFGNNRVYVLDPTGAICPIGVVGELCIGGDGVAVGYLNQEELTKEKFVADPFKEGERIYQTGDLARWLPDGKIEFLGRKDNQIKIRGYRIELGEIENVLASVPEVTQSCVLAREDEHGDKRLIGYVVMEGEGELDKAAWKESLQEELQQSLPEYMVPQLWVQLEEMPLTNNVKIDRKSLPDPDSSDLSSKEYVAPRTDAEAELVEIWQDLLGVEQVGVFDNFFELGGQSLLAIRLIARMQKLGYTVNIKDFYADPSIALLSTKLSSVDEGYQVPENGIKEGCPYITPSMVTLIDLSQEELERIMDQVPGGATNIQDIYPLAPLQEGIYFHHLMSDQDHGDPYLYSYLLSFSSQEKRAAFIEGLEFVIGRHDVLRTCVLNDGFTQALQVVLRQVDLPVSELSIDSSEEVLPQVEKEMTSNHLYMDLTTAPMLQVKVADDEANEAYYLTFSHHHLMLDHVGMAKVREEIMRHVSGQAGLLPTPALYRDFIGDTLNKEKLAESKQYFSELYGPVSETTYPFNLSDTKVDGSTNMVSSQVMLPPALRDRIRQASGDLQMSPATLFHAAFGLVVGKCSNTDHALFGTVLLGRLQGSKGADSSLGLFMNTLPILLDLKGDIPVYVKHANDRLQALLSYEQTPLSDIQNWSGVSNEVPLFSALLNYRHSAPGSNDTVVDLGGELLLGTNRSNYPFSLEIDDYGEDFEFMVRTSDIGIDPSSVISYMEESLL
ncbi:MAG: amino acid adenylation domain-containing protein, partial [Bacteroidota bacterium]